jgi:hypothetical protein
MTNWMRYALAERNMIALAREMFLRGHSQKQAILSVGYWSAKTGQMACRRMMDRIRQSSRSWMGDN